MSWELDKRAFLSGSAAGAVFALGSHWLWRGAAAGFDRRIAFIGGMRSARTQFAWLVA